VNTGVNRLNTAVQTVSTRVNRVDTSTARVNTSVNRVDTSVKRVDTSVQQVNTQVNRVNTGSKTICTSKEMTVVTINYNCMACHKQMHAVAQQPVLPNPVGRQNVLQMPVPQRPVPQLPNLVAKQMQPMPNLVNRMPKLPMPVVDPRVPQLPMPVFQYVQLFPVPVNQPQLVQMPVAPLPLWDLPVQMGTYPRPGLPMFVTRPSDLPKMTSSGSTPRKPTTEPSTLMAVARKSQESSKAVETPKTQIVMTKAMLEQPPELLMPVTAQSSQAPVSNGRLNLGAEPAGDENPIPSKAFLLTVHDDERDRPPLPDLPRAVWLPPSASAEVLEDFDRAPPVYAASGPSPLSDSTTPAGNVVRTPLTEALDAPPPLVLPSSIRTAG
jgi:hypothetical protein